MLPNLSTLSHHKKDVSGKYTLFGNEKSDWGVLKFDDYDEYLETFREWQRDGWVDKSEIPSKRRDGPEETPMATHNVEKKRVRVYTFMTKPNFKTRRFTDYDEYIREWEHAKQNGTLSAPNIKHLKNGDLVEYKDGAWRLIPTVDA